MFRTEIQAAPSPIKLQLSEKVITIGSCFSDAIGNELLQNKFEALVNPFGTVYNPVSIHKCLLYALENTKPSEQGFVNAHTIWSHFDFHSSFSALSKEESKNAIENSIVTAHHFLKKAQWLLITYGTAWVYSYNETGTIVANCHKIPSTQFSKSLLSQKRIIESFEELYKTLRSVNPSLKIILTVSPVRHLKDTLPLNSVSKSILRLTCQTLTETFENVFYFPAFEIMMDDLRDYRFYESDMLHPSEEAEHYIFQKFSQAFMNEATLAFIEKWQPIRQALKHKPFHPASESHQRFLQSLLKQLEHCQHFVNVDAEIEAVKAQLR